MGQQEILETIGRLLPNAKVPQSFLAVASNYAGPERIEQVYTQLIELGYSGLTIQKSLHCLLVPIDKLGPRFRAHKQALLEANFSVDELLRTPVFLGASPSRFQQVLNLSKEFPGRSLSTILGFTAPMKKRGMYDALRQITFNYDTLAPEEQVQADKTLRRYLEKHPEVIKLSPESMVKHIPKIQKLYCRFRYTEEQENERTTRERNLQMKTFTCMGCNRQITTSQVHRFCNNCTWNTRRCKVRGTRRYTHVHRGFEKIELSKRRKQMLWLEDLVRTFEDGNRNSV